MDITSTRSIKANPKKELEDGMCIKNNYMMYIKLLLFPRSFGIFITIVSKRKEENIREEKHKNIRRV